jgi:hypothetical protein
VPFLTTGCRESHTDMLSLGMYETADFLTPYTKTVGELLDAGVHVSLIHGDRDYRCNCQPIPNPFSDLVLIQPRDRW